MTEIASTTGAATPITGEVAAPTELAEAGEHDAHATARGGTEEPRRTSWPGVIGYGLSLGLLLLMLALACATIVVPKLTGSVPLTILSNSMAPGMPVGSLVVVRPTMSLDSSESIRTLDNDIIRGVNAIDHLRIGDVIAYQPNAADSTLIVHRITRLSIHADGTRDFITQGDNNAVADAPVHDYQVRAVAWYHFPYLGYVNNFLNADGGRHTTAVVIIAVAGYSWAMLLMWRAVRAR